jgi:hypothetical protein
MTFTSQGRGCNAQKEINMTTEEFLRMKWAEVEAERDAARAEVLALRHAVKSMLHVFDRDLPDGGIGRITCDNARAALEVKE